MGYLLVERWHAVYIGKEMTQQTQRGIKVIEVNKIKKKVKKN